MLLGIISDIHGNLPALEAVLSQLHHVDEVICLGDVVNYGPWSNECLDLLQTLPRWRMVEGNHEALFLGTEEIARELPLVQQFYRAAMAGFDRYEAIRDLPLEVQAVGFLFCHTLEGKKIYPDTPLIPTHPTFIGHSHHAFVNERKGHTLANPGSVGQNRRRLDVACHALLESETGRITLHETPYSAEPLLREMEARHYPEACLAYYRSKLP